MARASEIDGLVHREALTVYIGNNNPADANIHGVHFVMEINDKGTPGERLKARFVAQRFADREKIILAHASKTFRKHSIRLVVSIAATLGFRLWPQDVF